MSNGTAEQLTAVAADQRQNAKHRTIKAGGLMVLSGALWAAANTIEDRARRAPEASRRRTGLTMGSFLLKAASSAAAASSAVEAIKTNGSVVRAATVEANVSTLGDATPDDAELRGLATRRRRSANRRAWRAAGEFTLAGTLWGASTFTHRLADESPDGSTMQHVGQVGTHLLKGLSTAVGAVVIIDGIQANNSEVPAAMAEGQLLALDARQSAV